ncbi:MAG: acyl-CoA dehydrogenase family protein [Leptospiraceae bacterium]|nr:acyl-CoA dehydrogenase family protein [Leptospiraceae bacterium]
MNPGLKEYDLSYYKGLRNKNFFQLDKTLQKIVERYSDGISEAHKKDMLSHISKYGELVGGILNELTEKSHREGKYGEIQNYDSVGNRIDEVIYSAEQIEARRISYEHGVVNLDFHKNWKHPFLPVHRYALAYLMNLNGEGGVSCPLAMTEGMIEVLQKLGTESQKERFLPIVAGENSNSYFYAGQYVTERVGGSNVGANRTVARKLENGKWLLNGEKWFCSNPGDLWVTTAKVEGTNTIGLFLVSRYKSDGSLNGHKLIRKKDIIGSRGKLTAEVIYEDVEAEELGRISHGLANLIKYVISISRIHVGIGATGNARRALMEAIYYAKYRTAYGKGLLSYPIYTRNLTEMSVLQTVITLCNFKSIDYWKKEIPAADVTIPLMKYKSSSQATDLTHKAILCLGGNGIIGDFSPLPRLHNDSVINETWEGTHFLLTEHVLHALERRKSKESFFEELEKNILQAKEISYLSSVVQLFNNKVEQLKVILSEEKSYREVHRVQIADLAYECFALSEVLSFAYWESQNQKEKVFSEYLPILYKEILTFGCSGFAHPDSLILKPEIHKEIIFSIGLLDDF